MASEDTILYTAQQYTDHLGEGQQDFAGQQVFACQQLAPLIRCPHLSRYWLTASVNSAMADTMLLAELRPHLRRLLMLAEAQPSYVVAAADLQEGGILSDAPYSWALRGRVSKPVTRVELVWQLDVGALRDAAPRSAAEQCDATLVSPEVAPPLGGIGFRLKFILWFQDEGVKLSIYGLPDTLPEDVLYTCSYRVQVQEFASSTHPQPKLGSTMRGKSDFFKLGPMAGVGMKWRGRPRGYLPAASSPSSSRCLMCHMRGCCLMCSTSLTLGVGATMVAASAVAVVEAGVWALAASVLAAAAAVVDFAVGRETYSLDSCVPWTPHDVCGAAVAGCHARCIAALLGW